MGIQEKIGGMLILAALAYSSLTLGGCGTPLQLTSRWTEQAIQLDGDLKDWSDSTAFAEKEGIRYAALNDGEYLYVCLISAKPELGRQVMARGMTIWFDPNGGEKRTIGIRFPLGMGGSGRPDLSMRPQGQEPPQRGGRFEEIERKALNDFEYLGPAEQDRQRVSRLQGQGVEMHLTATPERFMYQLKIPLQYSSKHPYAVETRAGAKIGLGIDMTPTQRMMGGSRGEGQEGGGGGMPGTGGGAPGGRGGGRMPGGGRGGTMPGGGTSTVSISFWSLLQLSEKAR
jgi:hypothetical protein